MSNNNLFFYLIPNLNKIRLNCPHFRESIKTTYISYKSSIKTKFLPTEQWERPDWRVPAPGVERVHAQDPRVGDDVAAPQLWRHAHPDRGVAAHPARVDIAKYTRAIGRFVEFSIYLHTWEICALCIYINIVQSGVFLWGCFCSRAICHVQFEPFILVLFSFFTSYRNVIDKVLMFRNIIKTINTLNL